MLAPPKLPRHADPEALIPEARDRQRRRQRLAAASVAVAAGLALGFSALFPGRHTTALRPGGGILAAAQHCKSGQVSATLPFQGSTQMLVGGAVIKNIGAGACSLPGGWPRVRLSVNGKPLATHEVHVGHLDRAIASRLAPDARTWIPMQWANGCGVPHQSPRHGGAALAADKVEFTLQFADGLVVRAATMLMPPCLGPAGSPLGLVLYPARAENS
jgi:hypothetical protein